MLLREEEGGNLGRSSKLAIPQEGKSEKEEEPFALFPRGGCHEFGAFIPPGLNWRGSRRARSPRGPFP